MRLPRPAAMAMKRFVGVLLCALCVCPASAATIEAAPFGASDTGTIVISGTIQPGDDEIFSRQLMRFAKGVVVFRGDGGNLAAAINIGTAIRLKNYATLVPNESSCASACAIAWLGGSPRLMEDGAQIGFHAAYALKDTQPKEVGVPNALLGAYLSRIGLPDRAVIYIASAPPEGMTWLSPADAKKMGIELRTLIRPEAPRIASVSTDAPAPRPPPRPSIRRPETHAHYTPKHDQYFVSWMSDSLKRLGVKTPAAPVSRIRKSDNPRGE
jgi:hypothetical protein